MPGNEANSAPHSINCLVFSIWLILFVCHFQLFLWYFHGAAHFFPWGGANDLSLTLRAVGQEANTIIKKSLQNI